MSETADLRTPAPSVAAPQLAWARAMLARPAALLIVLSMLFGSAMILLNPPLRGPDEPAHFLRVYAYANGVILPTTEVDGRKGIELPARLHDDYAFFRARTESIWTPGFSFSTAMNEHRILRAVRPAQEDARDPVFVPFEGSESYTLAAYAPYVAAALVARALDLEFVTSLTLQRFAGLAAFTAVAAYAVAITPHLKWAFFLIAMLPASLYGRAVVGADGAAIGFALVVVALALRAIAAPSRDPAWRPVWQRALWMTLCVLAKPPQVAFILLEPMIHRWRDWRTQWRTILIVTAPGVVLTLLWIWAMDAEMAAWRVYADEGRSPEHFSLGWKLSFMLQEPLHFPRAMFATLFGEAFGLWRQLIGVLGWLDTHLHLGVYILLSVLFLPTVFERLSFDAATRHRVAVCAALAIAGYVTAVFLILFITWTPPEEPLVWGVQGRYFTGLLPLAGVMVAALANVSLPPRLIAGAALLGAVISGTACIEGLWRVNWAG